MSNLRQNHQAKWIVAIFISLASVASWGNTCKKLFRQEPNLTKIDEQFIKSYLRGKEEIDSFIKLAEKLRNQSADPVKTHIPEFGALMNQHLQFALKTITAEKPRGKSNKNDQSLRLQILNELINESNQKHALQQVTYKWWFIANLRLSILLTPEKNRSVERAGAHDAFTAEIYRTEAWKSEAAMNALFDGPFPNDSSRTGPAVIHYFPKQIAFPTIVGDIGISSLNKSVSHDIHPFGLIAGKLTADGREMFPDHFFGHDWIHFLDIMIQEGQYTPAFAHKHKRFQIKYTEIVESLPAKERQMVEFIYYLAKHELPSASEYFIHSDGSKLVKQIVGKRLYEITLYSMDQTFYGNALPPYVTNSKSSVKRYLIESGKEFTKFQARVNSSLD